MKLRTHHARTIAALEATEDWQDLAHRLWEEYGRLRKAALLDPDPAAGELAQARADGLLFALELMREYPVMQP